VDLKGDGVDWIYLAQDLAEQLILLKMVIGSINGEFSDQLSDCEISP
jgi:hypothetical protein